MAASAWFVLAIVVVALAFDFINGFHDAANSIATVVSTRVLSPTAAVVWAGVFNFVAFFVFGTAVAKTMGKGLVDLAFVDASVVLAGLLGAIAWNLITWYGGLPSSSSHALMGGYAGAAVAKAGTHAIIASGWVKPLACIGLSPMIGMAVSFSLTIGLSWLLRNSLPRQVDRAFRVLQLMSAAFMSLSHGSNDSQKTMGIIVSLLVAEQALFQNFPIAAFHVTSVDTIPTWVAFAAYAAIGAGTMAGGWRIVKTMGQRLTKLKPFGGFCAETGAAATIAFASHFGIPVSTTHTITGAITGVGAANRISAVRWGLAGRIVWAWILTIPAAAGIAGLSYVLLRAVGL